MNKIALPAAAVAFLLAFGLPVQPQSVFGPMAIISASAAHADRADRVERREDIREHRKKEARKDRRRTRRIVRRTMRRIDRNDWYVASLPGVCVIEMVSGIDFYRCGGKYYEPVLLDGREVYVIVTL